MNTLTLYLIFLIIPSIITSQEGWEVIDDPSIGGIDEIGYYDSSNCYMLSSTTNKTLIHLSNDNGKSWNLKYERDWRGSEEPIVINVRNISSPTPKHFFLIYFDRDELHRSRDSGETFDRIELYDGIRNLKKIVMLDSNVGIVTAHKALYLTHDGWDSFERIGLTRFLNFKSVEFLNDSIARGICFDSYNKNLAAGSSVVDINIYTGKIEEVFTFVSEDYQSYPNNFDFIDVVNDSVTYASGRRRFGIRELAYEIISKTTDNGKSWEMVLNRHYQDSYGIKNLRFFDENNGIAAVRHETVLLTNNGGKSWVEHDLSELFLSNNDVKTWVSKSIAVGDNTILIGTNHKGIFRYTGDFFLNSNLPEDTLSIEGRITENGIGLSEITLFNGEEYTVTDSNGNYRFSGLAEGKYTIEPQNYEFDFSPSQSTISLDANKKNIDFTAENLDKFFSIAGRVTLNGEGLPNVVIIAGDNRILSKENGEYFFQRLHKSEEGVPYLGPYYEMRAYNSDYFFTPTVPQLVLISDTTNIDFYLDTLTSVSNIDNYGDNTIYPNPANSVLYLDQIGLKQLTNCRIYDSKGKLAINIGNVLTSEKLDIYYLPSGVYHLRSTEVSISFVKE